MYICISMVSVFMYRRWLRQGIRSPINGVPSHDRTSRGEGTEIVVHFATEICGGFSPLIFFLPLSIILCNGDNKNLDPDLLVFFLRL